MILLTHHLKSTILFLRRVDGHLEYEVAVNGLGKILGLDAEELRNSLNSGEFCRHVAGYREIPHHEYTELFIREIEGKQKKITYLRGNGTSVEILVRADKVDEAITTIEYIIDMDLADD
jgi:hypothetical protein